ncbi:MAG: twin-arginine translocation signal domain-containing protein, partial [bacterium]
MLRITRREFLKYCSVAAGALGLSATTLMKVESVLANPTAPTVIWIAGAACTGCTMSLLNSVFYTTVDDLLLNRINLAY